MEGLEPAAQSVVLVPLEVLKLLAQFNHLLLVSLCAVVKFGVNIGDNLSAAFGKVLFVSIIPAFDI